MTISSNNSKQDFILLKIAGYDAKKQTVYGVNIETGRTISIKKEYTQKQPFIRNLATESDRLHAPVGSTVAFYGLTAAPKKPDSYRAEWATTVTKNLVDEIVIAAPTTVSPVIKLKNGQTQVKVRILDETPVHINSMDEVADAALLAAENASEITGNRGCILRTGHNGIDEAFSENIRLDNDLPFEEQIRNYVNHANFQTFKDVALSNAKEHSGYIEVVGYTDAINANYNDPKNDARRSKTKNFNSDDSNGGAVFSYAAVVYSKQYKNITQVVPLPALKQIKNVVGLVGSHSKVNPSQIPYYIPKQISDVQPTGIKVPPQYSINKPIDVKKHTNDIGQFTSVLVTIDPARIDAFEHRLKGITAKEPFIINGEKDADVPFKGFFFKKEYLDHISAILSDVADTPAIYTRVKSDKLFVLGRTDQEPFNSVLNSLAQSENGVEVKANAFSFPIEKQENVLNALGNLLELRAEIPATIVTAPKVIEEKVQHNSTANVSFKEWHEKRYGNSSKGIGDDQENVIAIAAAAMGIDWSETKSNIDWPYLGQSTSHGKNAAIPLEKKHSVYVNISYEHQNGFDTPGLSINFQNMDTHRGNGHTIQLTQDTYNLYEQVVKNDNFIPKVSESIEEIEAHKEKIKQANIARFAKENAYKAANRKIAFNYSLNLPQLTDHKILQAKKIPEAIQMLGLKESFNPDHPGIKAALFDVYDIHGAYAGYQEVFEEKIVIGIDSKTGENKLGNKLFNVGLSKQTAEGVPIGTHRVVGEIKDEPHVILYTESYANGVSNTLASGHPSVICLDVGNMKNVIGLMQKKHPNHTHIQVADNDIASIKKGNIGMLSALDNAYNLGVSFVKPDLSNIEEKGKISDTSDIHVHLGLDALAKNLNSITEPPEDAFAYHAERLLYVHSNALERQLTLTLKAIEQEDGAMENAGLIELATILLQQRSDMYVDSSSYESPVTPEALTNEYIGKLRSKYNGITEPTYRDIIIPPFAEPLEQEKTPVASIANNSIENQKTRKVSPYPVTVSVAINPREQGKHLAQITSPNGEYNEAIVAQLRANDIPFLRKPDGNTFTTNVKYKNLVNSALAGLTGAPELYSTKLVDAKTQETSVIVRGNFGDSTLRQKMEVVSGKKFDEHNKGFVFDSINDYIFVKEALKHHFTSQNPVISELEAIKLSEENTDLRAGIYKIADLFNKPSSSIAQSHVYMRIHNPRLAAIQSPLLAALYGETREAVKGMANFAKLDGNRKLDAVMHQLKREITDFQGLHPELAEKYSEHLSGALSIIDAQQSVIPEPVLQNSETVDSETVDSEIKSVETQPDDNETLATTNTVVEADATSTDDSKVTNKPDGETSKAKNNAEVELSPPAPAISEDKALQLRIANYIEVPSKSTKLVAEEIASNQEEESKRLDATEDVVIIPQEELLLEIDTPEEVIDATPTLETDTSLELRLNSLYENTKTYVEAKFDEFEFEEALKEPGSSHYDITTGTFKQQQFLDDIAQIKNTSLSSKFGNIEKLTAKYLFISVRQQLINERLEWMKKIFTEALKTDPNYNAYGIASKFSQKTVYGLINPYIQGYNAEDAKATGKKPAAYDKDMLADDLLTIGGQIDITTAAGYFKVIQAEYQRNNGFDNPEEAIDYTKGTELAEFTRYISPTEESAVEYFIVDDIVDGTSKTTLMIQGDDGLEEVENYRIESLLLQTYTLGSGFSESRSIAIGKQRIYQAVHFDFTTGTKKTAFPAISPDANNLVKRWIKTTDLELQVAPSDQLVSTIVPETNLNKPIVQEPKVSIKPVNNSPAAEIESNLPLESISRESQSKVFEDLFLNAINASLSYGDFYSEVFKSTGTLFHKNPYVVDGELDKVAVKEALKSAGFKSPKAMFDGIFSNLEDKLENVTPMALRDSGLISEYDPKHKLSETFAKIDELLQESGVVELSLAKNIISGTALSWVADPISGVLVHDILHEDLTQISPKFLKETYSPDAIKLLLDVYSVNQSNLNSLNAVVQQQKTIKIIEQMGYEGFLELDLATQEEMSKEIGVSRIVGSPRDLTQAAFERIADVKELAVLRNSQYSFIKAAVTIEKSGGKIPSSAVRQLNRLLNNETLYRPVIVQTIENLELQKIDQTVENAYAHLENLDASLLEASQENTKSTTELILRTIGAKNTLAEGTSERAELDYGQFKYQYIAGSNDIAKLDIKAAYYLKNGESTLSTIEPLDYSEMVNGGIYPANALAKAAMFSDTEVFANNGASILSDHDGNIATIHSSKNKFIVSVLNEQNIEDALVMSDHENYESALAFVFSSLSSSEYKFDSTSKENAVQNILNNLNLSDQSIEKVTSILNSDDETSQDLAAEIIENAEKLELTLIDTGDKTLDAQHILENSYRYVRLNAIADFVNLGGGNYSPELRLLQVATADIEVETKKNNTTELDEALSTLMENLSDEDLVDVQTSLAVDESANILKADELDELESLITAIEEKFETPSETVGDLIDDSNQVESANIIKAPSEAELAAVELEFQAAKEVNNNIIEADMLFDQEASKTLDEIALEALGINKQNVSDEASITEGDVVIGRSDGVVTFGYVVDSPEGLILSKYRYQDIDISKFSEQNIVKGFKINDKSYTLPLFALTQEEISAEINKENGAYFKPNHNDIANFISTTPTLKISEEDSVSVIIGNVASANGMFFSEYIEAFRVLSTLPGTPRLFTNEEALLIKSVTGESGFQAAEQWLTSQRLQLRAELASHLFTNGQKVEKIYYGINGLIQNEHNHIDESNLEDISDLNSISSVEIRSKLSGNTTLNKLIADITLPTESHSLLTELVLTQEDISLVENIIENGAQNTDRTVIESGQWQDLPTEGETQPVAMSKEEVLRSTQGNKIFSRAEEVLYLNGENELDFGLVFKDTFEVDKKIVITDEDGRAKDSVNTETTSSDIDKITSIADSELKIYIDGQLLRISEPIVVDDLRGERELKGIDLLAIYLATNKFNNEIRKDIDLLSVPNGYEVILDNNEYALSREEELTVLESTGKHSTMAELRKAILVAKRSNTFTEELEHENNRTESTRKPSTESPTEILPSEIEEPDQIHRTGKISDQQTDRGDRNNRIDENTDGQVSNADQPNILSGESGSQQYNRDRSNDTSSTIDLSANGNGRTVDFTPNIDFTFDDELIEALTKPMTISETYNVNIAAIKLSKTITSENRSATHEEKRTLAQYRGWGGAKAIFSGSYQHSDRRTELSEWLTAEEYESARRSVLSAFYTSPHITKATWSILTRLGIKGGIGLEPSFGTGNFASTIPAELQETSALQGRELDTVTGEISGHIHGDLVKTAGFESTNFPSNHFDFSIGNIPFGDYKVYDKNHKDLSNNLIHDYFILKMLDKVKPGGFVPVLTSSGTMDKKSDNVRQEISKTANLVGAIRLPNSAFKDNSGTEALIDILVFQKREPGVAPSDTNWLDTSSVELPLAYANHQTRELLVNNYFKNNSEMVIGELVAKSSRYGYEIGVLSEEEQRYKKAPDLLPLLNAAIDRLPENIHFEYVPKVDTPSLKKANINLHKEQASSGKVGGYVLNSSGNVSQLQLEVEFNTETLESEEKLVSIEVDLPNTKLARLSALISLKESTIKHLNLMASVASSDSEIDQSMVELNAEYDAVVKKYKALNSRTNKSIFKEDPESGVLLSLEHYNRQDKTATKADLFTERTVFPNKVFENIDDPQEATLISLAEYGRIVPEYVSELTGKPWSEITSELSGNIFENPETGGWDSENAYLSGNVREKLEAAEAAAAIDNKFQLNVDYLKEVIPETIPYFEIRAKLGSDWLPATDIQDFIKYIVTGENEPATPSERGEFKVIKVNGQWNTDISRSVISRYEGNTKTAFGTEEWDACRLIEAALNNSPVKVYHPTQEDGSRELNTEATANAQAKFELVKENFKSWVWSNEARAVRLEGLYNRLRNAFVEPKFDGSKIQFNGLSPFLAGAEFTPREKQRNAVMRYLTTGKCLYIHDVGVGKSFTLLASIMKGHEVGRHTKPILTVPKSVFPQMQSLALSHFPNAKILMLDTVKTTNPKDKAVVINKIAMNNWDIIILPHTVLPKLDVPLDFKLDLINEELEQIEHTLTMLDDEGFASTSSLTRTQSKLEKERAKLERALDEDEVYEALNIAELGIDAIFVDEADEFVNLKKITTLGAIKGVGSTQSARATALHRITEYLHREVKDAGVVLATGTDIRNNMADLYTLMRFADPTLLESSEVILFDDFVGSFGDIQTQFEIAPEGSGYIEVTRLNKFINIPELLMMYRQVADVVTAEQAGVKRPVIEEIHVKGEQCEYLEAYMGVLAHRAERSRNGNPVFENDNLLAISGGGRKSSLSMNLIDSSIPFNDNSKVAQCITNVATVYKENIAMNPSQIIFSDMGVPNKSGRFDLYNQIKEKLVESGVPEQKIVFARDFNTDIRKQDLQDRMNSGDIAVCIGSTENMGVGKNVQKRLAAIHDLSIPWRYRDMVQRLGRIERFGNLFPNAKRFIYITEDSFDLFILQKVMQKAQITLQAKLSPRDSVREFIDDVEPKHSDIMALGTSNPVIQQALEVESQIIKLEIAEKSFHKSLVNLRANKNDAERVQTFAEKRLVTVNEMIGVVKGQPIVFGDLEMRDEANILTVSKALNKAIKASVKADGQRKFKVGKVGDANIVIEAKFNGNYVSSIETKDFQQEIGFAKNLKPLIAEMTTLLLPKLEEKRAHTVETIENVKTRIEVLDAQNTSSVFPQTEELQEARATYRELEAEKANLLNEAVEVVDPMERFDDLIDELHGSSIIEMKQADKTKDLWEPDIEIKIEPVA